MWSSTTLSYLYILFFTNIYIIWGSVVWRILMYVFLKSWMCDHWCKKQLCILSTKLFLYFCLCYVIVEMWKQTLCTKKYFSIIYKQHCKKSQYTVVENLYSSLTWHTSCTFPYIVILSCSFNFCLFHKVDFFRKDFQAEMFNWKKYFQYVLFKFNLNVNLNRWSLYKNVNKSLNYCLFIYMYYIFDSLSRNLFLWKWCDDV